MDEASYGPEHRAVVRDLDNLAWLLEETNRLGEAEPPMRRMLVIFLAFTRQTARLHPHLGGGFSIYWAPLGAMDLTEDELGRRILALGPEAGVDEDDVRRLLQWL